ncbi:hypothetical protein [Bacillus infantis]|uniref:hypothetical protein n=1 Tax=Bacillus infantis TaxID=324767 RepID=UPI000B9A69F2|nr:hypothetical protein [Bacillus infantis]MCK6206503.1 hypothetical protein [Bacillus infantis]MCP1161064.1 hypothetical protein [Bacillus infantis]OXT17874.1 hypothetical protein B9K06_08355 [Bacillus sp. OG2]
MEVIQGKDLKPKFFALGLILAVSCLPISVLGVNAIQKFYFQPDYHLFFSIPKTAYLLFIIGYSILFVILALLLSIADSKFKPLLILSNILLSAIAVFFLWQSFQTHSYLTEGGLKVKAPFAREQNFEWDSIQKVTQISKHGVPYRLEFHIKDAGTYKFDLQSEFIVKRSAFYSLLAEQNVEIESRQPD